MAIGDKLNAAVKVAAVKIIGFRLVNQSAQYVFIRAPKGVVLSHRYYYDFRIYFVDEASRGRRLATVMGGFEHGAPDSRVTNRQIRFSFDFNVGGDLNKILIPSDVP